MEKMEGAFKDASKAFDISTKLALGWVSDARKRIVELGAKIEDNRKNIHGIQERITNNVTEISGAKAGIEVHEDRIARLEEKIRS